MRRQAVRCLRLLYQVTGAAGGACRQRVNSSALSDLTQQCTSTVQQQCSTTHHFRRLAKSRGFAGGPGPARPSHKIAASPSARAGGAPAAKAGAKAAAAAAAGAASSGSKASSPFGRWWKAFQSAPTVPKVLGLAGAIPFIALAPPVSKHLVFVLPAEVVDNSAMIQVCYGVTIVSFLGAVHWGVAMSSSLTGPAAARIANEGFIYSVIPSLCAWPAALMEPGAGAVVLSILLPACYGADYGRRNMGLPQWYMALRIPLTLLATYGMLLTATRHVHSQLDYAKELTQREKDKETAAGATAAAK